MGTWGWGGGSSRIWEGSGSCAGKQWGGGGEGKEGWERPKPKLWLGRFSTVKPLPLGECCWLVH